LEKKISLQESGKEQRGTKFKKMREGKNLEKKNFRGSLLEKGA